MAAVFGGPTPRRRGPTVTTSSTGRTAVPPSSTTWFLYAGRTTARCTSRVGGFTLPMVLPSWTRHPDERAMQPCSEQPASEHPEASLLHGHLAIGRPSAPGSGQRANSSRCETLQPRLNVHGDGTRDNRTRCRRARVPFKASDQERDSEHRGEDVPRSLPYGSSLTHRYVPLYLPSGVRKASAP